MALEVRRIVTGHDSQGKAVVATDERLAGTSAAGRAGISRVDVWSTDKMPIDNSDAAAELQRKGFVVRHNYVGSGQGSVCRVVEFAPGAAKFMHRTETLDYAICLKGECDLELDNGRTVDEGGRHLRAARHDARLGRQGLGARGLRLRPDRRRASREGRKKADDPLTNPISWFTVCEMSQEPRFTGLRPPSVMHSPPLPSPSSTESTTNRSRRNQEGAPDNLLERAHRDGPLSLQRSPEH